MQIFEISKNCLQISKDVQSSKCKNKLEVSLFKTMHLATTFTKKKKKTFFTILRKLAVCIVMTVSI